MGVYTEKRSGRLYVQFDMNGTTYKKRLPESATRESAIEFEKGWRSQILEDKIVKGDVSDFGDGLVVSNRSNKGFLYVVRCGDNFKIGHTFNFSRRLKALRHANPFGVHTVLILKLSNPSLVERRLHRLFAERHWTGEWFKLNGEDLEFLRCFVGGKALFNGFANHESCQKGHPRPKEKGLRGVKAL